MPLAQQEANSRASAGVPTRKPVRPESTLSWRTWLLSTPIPTTDRSALRGMPLDLVLLIRPTRNRDPTCRWSTAAASGVATTWSGLRGSARRPAVIVIRS